MGTFYLIAPYLEGTGTKRLSFFNETNINTVQPPSSREISQPPFTAIFISFTFLFIQSTESCTSRYSAV